MKAKSNRSGSRLSAGATGVSGGGVSPAGKRSKRGGSQASAASRMSNQAKTAAAAKQPSFLGRVLGLLVWPLAKLLAITGLGKLIMRVAAATGLSKLAGKIGTALKRVAALPLRILERLTPQWIKRLNANYKIALTLTLVLAVWMASGMLSSEPPEVIDASNRENNNLKAVLVREFSNSPTERIIRLSGVSEEERMVEIKAELSAQVEQINFQEGAEVAANVSIIKLEQEEALARLRQAQSQANQAQLELSSQRRLRSQGLTSEANLAQAQANYESARAAASLAQKQFDATEVQAPFAGRIERVYVEQGDFVQPGQLLASVFDYDPIVVRGDLSELEVNFIELGNRVVVKFITGEELEGRVSFVAKTADRQSRTFEVQVEVDNPDGALLAGITAELDFYTGTIDATKIPASVISINAEGKIGVKGVTADNKVLFYPVEVVKAETNEMWVSDIPQQARIIVRGFGFVEEDEIVDAQLDDSDDALN